MLKVTDITKQTTDPVLLSHLAKHGIDPEGIEFSQDYAKPAKGEKGKSPFAKFYRDLNSNKCFMVVSGLPMVNADGIKVEVGWNANKKTFTNKVNHFLAEVKDTKVSITTINDQPDGRKQGANLTFQPQLFLDGKEVKPISKTPALLVIDPQNENYSNNVLEWDYGICKRRLRLIEGRIHGYWVFSQNPNADVKIVYNQKGDFNLKLGQYATDSDTEQVPLLVFNSASYPFEVSDSQTFYPDAHPESTTVDGDVIGGDGSTALTWAQIIASAGNYFNDSATNIRCVFMRASSTTNKWIYLGRGITLFNITGIPANATISGFVASLYGVTRQDDNACTPDINLYSSAPASNTALAAGDFDSLDSTAFCDTAITYANFSTSGYNDFSSNASGLTFIKTAYSGDKIVKLGFRNTNYDVSGTPPAWVSTRDSRLDSYSAEKGTGYKPKLVVTYTVPAAYSYTSLVKLGLKCRAFNNHPWYIALAKLGIKPLASRAQTSSRNSLVKVGVKPIPSRKSASKRSGLIKLGGKVFANRVIAGIRTGLAKEGLKPIPSRLIASTRSGLAKEGIKGLATRGIASIRSSLVKLGNKVLANRIIASIRSGLTKLGIKAWASFVHPSNYIYTALTKLGLNPLGTRKISALRSAPVKIGIVGYATRQANGKRTGLDKLGLKAIASRSATSIRTGLIKTVLKPLATRTITATRSGLTKIGDKVLANGIVTRVKLALAKIGLKAFAQRQASSIRPALVKVGIKDLATRNIAANRSGLAKIGIKTKAYPMLSWLIHIFSKPSNDLTINTLVSNDLRIVSLITNDLQINSLCATDLIINSKVSTDLNIKTNITEA